MNWKKFILLSYVAPCIFAVSTATAQMRGGHSASMARMPMPSWTSSVCSTSPAPTTRLDACKSVLGNAGSRLNAELRKSSSVFFGKPCQKALRTFVARSSCNAWASSASCRRQQAGSLCSPEFARRCRYPCGLDGWPGFAASPGLGGAPPAAAPPGSSASAGTAKMSGSVNDSG